MSITLSWTFVVTSPSTAAAASQPAWLNAATANCLAEISGTASHLIGHPVNMTADAFLQNHSVPLSSVGQMADGRMLRPTQVLQLRIDQDGCKLGLVGKEDSTPLKTCQCRIAATPLVK